MAPLALALVLTAACTHAVWNLFAKRAAGVRHFVLLYSAFAVVLWSPVAVVVPWPPPTTPFVAGLVGTAAVHLVYSLLLQHSYRVADLSLVYPVVRGTGPLLAFVGAVLVLGERPTPLSVLGAALVATGVFMLAGGRANLQAALLGVVTGALVASYTVLDGWLVKHLGLSPVLVDFVGNLARVLFLAPVALRGPGLRADLRAGWKEALIVATLAPLGYVLVLTATRLAPISHVAPARELSMLVATWLGGRVLGEADTRRRVGASALVVAGVICLAMA